MKLLLVCVALLFAFTLAKEYKVRFQLKTGNITLHVNSEWAPNGVERFMKLVKEKYYDDNGFFRVVPNFVVQFGINGDPKISGKYRNARIQDDKVIKSNLRGWVSYAAMPQPHTRTTQLFINLVNNQRLDGMGFAPFAYINEKDMKLVDKIYSGYGQRPNQASIYSLGNSYLKQTFPNLDYLKKARVIKK
eukprot:gene596-8101_t